MANDTLVRNLNHRLPFSSIGDVMPGATINILIGGATRPPIKPHRIVLPRDLADHLTLVSFRIGGEPQFFEDKEVPCAAFSQDSDIELKCDDCFPDTQILLKIRNEYDKPLLIVGEIQSKVIQ